MTDASRHFGSNRVTADRTGVFRWKNTSGETVPAFGCIKLNSYNDVDEYYNAVKPDGNGSLHLAAAPGR